jgi:hypothetical protein
MSVNDGGGECKGFVGGRAAGGREPFSKVRLKRGQDGVDRKPYLRFESKAKGSQPNANKRSRWCVIQGEPLFEPGTTVEITIKPAPLGDYENLTTASDRADHLLAVLDRACNTEQVGPPRRAELHDRDVLR